MQFFTIRRGPYVSQVGNMDPSVLNEQSTKCECEFSIRYGDIFSESVPTMKHAVHSAFILWWREQAHTVQGESKPAV